MAHPKPHPPALLLAAIFSRYDTALDWGRSKISASWGPIALESQRFNHAETSYYETQMGTGLKKQFLLCDEYFDPTLLSATKLQSNAWEAELAGSGRYPQPRPLNIDPGYLTLTKFVLASAKDRAHRIYLADGIYAEECLYYLDHHWRPRPWTYPDYRRADFQIFFVEAREFLKRKCAV